MKKKDNNKKILEFEEYKKTYNEKHNLLIKDLKDFDKKINEINETINKIEEGNEDLKNNLQNTLNQMCSEIEQHKIEVNDEGKKLEQSLKLMISECESSYANKADLNNIKSKINESNNNFELEFKKK